MTLVVKAFPIMPEYFGPSNSFRPRQATSLDTLQSFHLVDRHSLAQVENPRTTGLAYACRKAVALVHG